MIGGVGPALVASVLSVVAADYFLIPPLHGLSLGDLGDLVPFGVFLVTSLLVSSIASTDCMLGRLYEFDIPAPGVMAPPTSMAPGRVVSTLPGFQWLDSLAVEAGGRICVATLWNGGVTVFEPSGAAEHVPFPDP